MDLAKLAVEHWPNITLVVLVALLSVRIVRAMDKFSQRLGHLEELAAAELTWRLKHESFSEGKIDEIRQFAVSTLLMQKDVQSLSDSVRVLRDGQQEMQKYGMAAMEALMEARRIGLLRVADHAS